MAKKPFQFGRFPGLPFIVLSATFPLMCVFQLLHAQEYLGEIYQPVQLSFTSRYEYAHPHRDVELRAEFYSPEGSGYTYRIAGFWDGDKTYRVRFAAPDTGLWTFQTFASDTGNTTLHHQTGRIRVLPASGENTFSKKGWPRVSANSRYFSHADSSPIFLLSDAAWEMAWKSTDEEVEAYIANRKAKGFNCIQLVAMSHIYMHPYGVINQHGEKFALDDDLSFLNPRYFDHLDRIVELANAAGIVVEIVPLWGRIIEFVGEELGYKPAVKVDEALLMARYLGARYAGHNVMWIVAGDWRYDEPQQNAFWDRFGRVLQEASGNMHLTSIHTTGFFGSFSFYGENADWLDYHLYSVGHDIINLGYNWIGAREGYAAKPAKPVRNAETNYEDILHKFWEVPAGTIPPRVAPVHVREAAYQSVLSGAIAGFSYGANGVWQWSTDWLLGGLLPRQTVLNALDFPGAFQMGAMKKMMEKFDWFDLIPAQELLIDARLHVNASGHANLPVAKNDRYVLAYFPAKTASATLAICGALPTDTYSWLSPRDGAEFFRSPVGSNTQLTLSPPDSSDWLLVIESTSISILPGNCIELENEIADTEIKLLGNIPNPFHRKTQIVYQVGRPGTAMIEIFDLLGREIFREHYTLAAGSHWTDIDLPNSGIYFYRILFQSDEGRPTVKTGKLIALSPR